MNVKLKNRICIGDIETNRLKGSDKIWCIVLKDILTNEIFRFSPNSPTSGHLDWAEAFIKFYQEEVCKVIGHNFVAFDRVNINRILGFELIKLEDVIDTLILSRLLMPVMPFKHVKGRYNREYGHGLAAWGRYLGSAKIDFHEFDKFSEPMLTYCVQDVNLTHLIYLELMKEIEGFSPECMELEHHVAQMLAQQEENGFYLDPVKAEYLRSATTKLLEEMNAKLQQLFPPVYKLVRNYNIKHVKDGSVSKVSQRIIEGYQTTPGRKAILKEDGSYDLMAEEAFNPASGNNVADRLLAFGWKPKHYTEKGNIKTDKATLQEGLQELLEGHPERADLQCLVDYGIVSHRNQTVLEWLELAKDDGRVHGQINPIGAGTHRCSHFNPNMANIARVSTAKAPIESFNINGLVKFDRIDNDKVFLKATEKDIEYAQMGIRGAYGWDSRDCWSVPSNDLCLVGADAAGIQLRALAHYMADPVYTESLLKEDIHAVNQKAAGISSRAKAKTFIYSWLMGGGDEKIGSIVGVEEAEWPDLFKFAESRKHWDTNLLQYFISSLRSKNRKADRKTVATVIKGYKVKEQFLDRTPALKRLKKKDIPEAAKRGYLIGLDGRKLWIPNEHLAMSIYLQGFEAVIMKQAMRYYHEDLRGKGIYFKQCSFTHDEFQVETKTSDATEVGQSMVEAIRKAGETFKTNCPLDGEYKIGRSWAQTH